MTGAVIGLEAQFIAQGREEAPEIQLVKRFREERRLQLQIARKAIEEFRVTGLFSDGFTDGYVQAINGYAQNDRARIDEALQTARERIDYEAQHAFGSVIELAAIVQRDCRRIVSKVFENRVK